jgi:hypothetical protein
MFQQKKPCLSFCQTVLRTKMTVSFGWPAQQMVILVMTVKTVWRNKRGMYLWRVSLMKR